MKRLLQVKNTLVESGQFKPGKLTQRLYFYKDNLPVDIVPFGKIARDGESISWPSKHEIEMSISYLRNASGQIDSIFMIYSAPNQL
jgi:predicted nucleotidyltransferase